MKLLLFLILFTSVYSFSQSKIETFCLENGLEVVSVHEGKTVAKFYTNESAAQLAVTYGYDFEAVFYFTENEAKLTSVRNTKCSNNGVALSMTEYRGMHRENILKKSWQRIVDSVNKRCQEIVEKYNSYITE